MATRQELEQAIHDELANVVATYRSTSLADANSHIDRAQMGADSIDLPGFTFSIFEGDMNRGIHGSPEVRDITVDDANNDVIIEYARPKRATVDVAAHARRNDQTTVNALYSALEAHVTRLQSRTPGADVLHTDVHESGIEVQGSQDVSDPQDDIRGDRFRLTVDYDRTIEATTDLMATVETTIEDFFDDSVQYDSFDVS